MPAAAAAVDRFEPAASLFMMRGPEGTPVPNAYARAIWDELAPEAFEAGTLTKRTAAAFAMMCRAVAVERCTELPDADHRGLIQRIATMMKDFALAPLGKPIVTATPETKPMSALERLQAQSRQMRRS